MTDESPSEFPVETFDSERVHVEVTKQNNCRINLLVKANAKVSADAKKTAVRQIAKEVSIPGFRKGKAPASIIEKKYHSALIEQWEKAFADITFQEAQTLAKVPLLNGNSKINFKIASLKKEGGEVNFQFESEPRVPEIAPTEFKLAEIKEDVVDDVKVDETIKNIQMFYAKWEQVEDRPVKEGDFVVLDIDDIDQDPPVQAFSNSRFEVADKKMATWMKELVIGKNLNDSVEGESKPDEDESEEVKKDFKKKRVKIHINGIEEAILPPVDNEFATKVGVPNVDALKIQLKNLLIKQAKEKHQKELRDSIADQLIEKIEFDVPASVLEQEANHRISTLLKQADFSKKWNESMSEEEKEKKKLEIKKHAIDALKLFYISRRIVADNKISVSEAELSPEYDSLLEMMFADPNRVNFKSQSKEHQAVEFSKFMMAKAQDFLIEKIKSAEA